MRAVRRISSAAVKVPASLVKELRELTSAPLMECKRALEATNTVDGSDDFKDAKKWLASKGLEAASKKQGRDTAEGRLGVAATADRLVVVELNSETDFVARNADFNEFCAQAARTALDGGDVAGVAREAAAAMRENVNCDVRLDWSVESDLQRIGLYVHGSTIPGTGSTVGALKLFASSTVNDAQSLANDLAKQIVAATPEFLETAHVDTATKDKLLASTRGDSSLDSKPKDVKLRIEEGRLKKAYKELVLREQDFLFEECSVSDLIEKRGGTVELLEFRVLKVGDAPS